jgi:hypothetical protein
LNASTASSPRQLLIHAARPAIAALRRLWLPFVMIQFSALLVVIAYFRFEPFAKWCNWLGQLKAEWGILFVIFTMPLAGVVVPEIAKFITRVDTTLTRQRLADVVYLIPCFAIIGIVVDLFYRGMNTFFSDGPRLQVVVTKVLLDQLVFTPLIGAVYLPLAFLFRRTGFSIVRTVRELSPGWYLREVVPILLPIWAYWIPMCVLMYALPAGLTFIFGVCGSAASATIMVSIASRHHRPHA